MSGKKNVQPCTITQRLEVAEADGWRVTTSKKGWWHGHHSERVQHYRRDTLTALLEAIESAPIVHDEMVGGGR